MSDLNRPEDTAGLLGDEAPDPQDGADGDDGAPEHTDGNHDERGRSFPDLGSPPPPPD